MAMKSRIATGQMSHLRYLVIPVSLRLNLCTLYQTARAAVQPVGRLTFWPPILRCRALVCSPVHCNRVIAAHQGSLDPFDRQCFSIRRALSEIAADGYVIWIVPLT